MNFLITEISVSLLIAFVLGCIVAWLWRSQQLRRQVAEAERQATQRGQLELANLHAELETHREDIAELHDENERLSTQLSEGEGQVLIASSAEESENLKAKLIELKNRHSALHTRWERERTQFAQLVTHKNNQIAALERLKTDSEEPIIEDGTSVDTDEDARTYSRQQLESMLVDMRAKVADQESELGELRSLRDNADSRDTAAAQPIGLSGRVESDADLRSALTERDTEIAQLKASLSHTEAGPRLAEVEQERANLLHRISALNSQRADDAEHTAKLHTELETLRTGAQQTEEQLGGLKQENETLNQQCSTLQAELNATRERAEQLPELEAKCARLSGDITTLQSLLDATKTERDSVQLQSGHSDTLRSEKRTLQTEIATLQASLSSAKRDIESREQQIRQAQTELDELRPLQHQLVNLRSSLGDLLDRDSRGEHASVAHAEVESLRTRIAKLQAESKLNLERKESYYQGLLREKTALIADLKRQSETEA